MAIEEAAGPAGPKVLRLLYFVGAGFIFTVAINKWREVERKSFQKQHQQQSDLPPNLLPQSSPNAIPKPSN
ncbi:uncharacterized protein LOC110601257 [Manihot esculenta]|uniref:Transmembrane protein n=1 Tax=Manihot esculenta TaxID=3983 RepID=A0A2C9UEE8_MANES|nr:uncharacterized protein LOC110601257 [Manihot esculenta]XP_043806902.1 uncharacterized protein LOC110601257 [Manihot esculenta]OAY28802.1 hypothetical protein MANES_15G095500v8 [Manihot esculenta]